MTSSQMRSTCLPERSKPLLLPTQVVSTSATWTQPLFMRESRRPAFHAYDQPANATHQPTAPVAARPVEDPSHRSTELLAKACPANPIRHGVQPRSLHPHSIRWRASIDLRLSQTARFG